MKTWKKLGDFHYCYFVSYPLFNDIKQFALPSFENLLLKWGNFEKNGSRHQKRITVAGGGVSG